MRTPKIYLPLHKRIQKALTKEGFDCVIITVRKPLPWELAEQPALGQYAGRPIVECHTYLGSRLPRGWQKIGEGAFSSLYAVEM